MKGTLRGWNLQRAQVQFCSFTTQGAQTRFCDGTVIFFYLWKWTISFYTSKRKSHLNTGLLLDSGFVQIWAFEITPDYWLFRNSLLDLRTDKVPLRMKRFEWNWEIRTIVPAADQPSWPLHGRIGMKANTRFQELTQLVFYKYLVFAQENWACIKKKLLG